MRRVLRIALATAAIGLGMAAPAGAATVVGNVSVAGATNTCDTTPPSDLTPAASACAGYFAGNILDNSPSDKTTITAALSALGITYTGDISNYIGGSVSGSSLATFLGSPGGFTGTQVIGIHWGNGSAQDDPTVGNATAFYKINFGSTPTDITLNLRGISNAYLFTSAALPEPATWGMMLLGFAGIGFAMRRSRRQNGALMQVA